MNRNFICGTCNELMLSLEDLAKHTHKPAPTKPVREVKKCKCLIFPEDWGLHKNICEIHSKPVREGKKKACCIFKQMRDKGIEPKYCGYCHTPPQPPILPCEIEPLDMLYNDVLNSSSAEVHILADKINEIIDYLNDRQPRSNRGQPDRKESSE